MVLRIFWNLGAGVLHHAIAKKPAKPGLGVLYPVVWRARTGFLDCDVNMHLNNASYLYTMELARWHFAGVIGMVPTYLKKRMAFLAAANSIRYRHPIPPFAAYEIHTRVVYWDNDWMYFLHQFICPESGKLYAEALCRATLKQGRKRIPMREVYRDATGDEVDPEGPMPPVVEEFLKWDAASRVSMEATEEQTRAKAKDTKWDAWRRLTVSWNNPFRNLD